MKIFQFIFAFFILFSSLNTHAEGDFCDEITQAKITERLEFYVTIADPIRMMALIDSIEQVKGFIDLNGCPSYLWIEYYKGESYYLLDKIEESLNQYYFVIKKAIEIGNYRIVSESYLSIALIHEIYAREMDCLRNLEKARQYIDLSNDKAALPRYYVRFASYTRIFFSKAEALVSARKAIESAILYNDVHQEIDGNLLMGICTEKLEESIVFFQRSVDLYLQEGQYYGAAAQANNIGEKYLKERKYDLAKKYKDLTLTYLQKSSNLNSGYYDLMLNYLDYKKNAFLQDNQLDSALSYADKMLQIKDKSFYDINQLSVNEIEIKSAVDQEKLISKALKERESLFMRIILVCFVLISIIGALLYSLLKNKKKIAIQKNEIALKNEDLTLSNNKFEGLLSEVHHRVKNNLQNVVSLLVIQKEYSSDDVNKEVFTSLSNKILSMSLIHDQLYNEGVYDLIDLEKYFNNLIQHFKLSAQPFKVLNYTIQTNKISLNNETLMPLALTVTELINNSIKYATIKRKELKVTLNVEEIENNTYQFTYHDDGPGYPEGTLKRLDKTMGALIIQSMVRQLLGSFETYNENGAVFKMQFVEKK